MKTTTDIRTITCGHIALDPQGGSGARLLAKVLGPMPDGSLRLLLINIQQRVFYKDGVLFRTAEGGRQDIGAYAIVWQGGLPGDHSRDVKAGREKVARRIAAGESGVVSYDEMPVTVSRGTLRTIADALALSGKLGPDTRAAIEAAYRAAE